MLKIAICDDDLNDLKMTDEFFKSYDKNIETSLFTNGNDLLEMVKQQEYDIICLDIDMPVVSGFDTAGELYDIKYGDNLIFVSNMESAVFQALEFRPFRFVRKGHLDTDLKSALDAWIKTYGNNEHIKALDEDDCEVALKISDIVYIEIKGHYLNIVTRGNTFHKRGKISDYEYLVEQGSFLKIHGSYMCNIKYIKNIIKDRCIMYNDEELKIGQKRVAECKKNFMKYISRR